MPASRSSSVRPEGRFSFFHPKVKVKKNNILNFFRILGVGWSEGVNKFYVISRLFNKCCFLPTPFPRPPHSSCQGEGVWPKNEKHGLNCILSHLKPFQLMLFFYPPSPPHLFDFNVNPVLPFKILNSQKVRIPSLHL